MTGCIVRGSVFPISYPFTLVWPILWLFNVTSFFRLLGFGHGTTECFISLNLLSITGWIKVNSLHEHTVFINIYMYINYSTYLLVMTQRVISAFGFLIAFQAASCASSFLFILPCPGVHIKRIISLFDLWLRLLIFVASNLLLSDWLRKLWTIPRTTQNMTTPIIQNRFEV